MQAVAGHCRGIVGGVVFVHRRGAKKFLAKRWLVHVIPSWRFDASLDSRFRTTRRHITD